MLNEHNLDMAERWLAGERGAEIETALRGDAALRAYVADVEKLRLAAAALEEDTAEPPDRIWVALRAQLASEGILRSAEPASSFWATVREGWQSLAGRPALAGVYALVLMAMGLAGLMAVQNEEQPRFTAQSPSVEGLMGAQLEPVAAQTGRELERRNPEVAAEYRNNLAIVDNFISLCEKTVREQPDNTLAREYLYSAYQQKADLLTAMVERSTGD